MTLGVSNRPLLYGRVVFPSETSVTVPPASEIVPPIAVALETIAPACTISPAFLPAITSVTTAPLSTYILVYSSSAVVR